MFGKFNADTSIRKFSGGAQVNCQCSHSYSSIDLFLLWDLANLFQCWCSEGMKTQSCLELQGNV